MIESLLSGVAGGALILGYQEVRKLYSQKRNQFIGTITLVHQIHSNANMIESLDDTVIAELRRSVLAFKDKPMSRLDFSASRALTRFKIQSLQKDKNITLKNASLGCFYAISQANTFTQNLVQTTEHLVDMWQRYNDVNSDSYNFANATAEFSQRAEESIELTTSLLYRVMTNYHQLLEWTLESLNQEVVNLYPQSDLNVVKSITQSTLKTIDSFIMKHKEHNAKVTYALG